MSLLAQDNSDHWIDYPKPGEKFQHYKGGIYEIITLSKDTRDDSTLVIYKSLLFGSVCARPLIEWYEEVPTTANQGKIKRKTKRFVRIK